MHLYMHVSGHLWVMLAFLHHLYGPCNCSCSNSPNFSDATSSETSNSRTLNLMSCQHRRCRCVDGDCRLGCSVERPSQVPKTLLEWDPQVINFSINRAFGFELAPGLFKNSWAPMLEGVYWECIWVLRRISQMTSPNGDCRTAWW